MEALPDAAAALVAAHLADERHLAALACTCRFWRQVLGDQALWRELLSRRFGAAAAAQAGPAGTRSPPAGQAGDADAAGPAGAAAPAVLPPRQLFRELATLVRPAPRMERVVWLDGAHLQEVTEPGSSSGRAVRVHGVSWLELAARFTGVLPGRYQAVWRLRLQGTFQCSGARLATRQLPASCPAACPALALGRADPQLAVLKEDGVRGRLWRNAAAEPAEARTTLTLVTRAQLDQAFHQAGSDWFELRGGPIELPEPSVVYLKFHALEGFSSGIIFDTARLERL